MNKLSDDLKSSPNNFITRSLPFAATLVTLGYELIDVAVSTAGDVSFIIDGRREDLQDKYERWHIEDIPVPSRTFCSQWRRLRRLIDATKQNKWR